ncbi:hypothetical protein IF2G_07225 [Cordyceps javanica]|nr:hypothetical protein IF2G_07225 [Cordyceps javanica]
MPVIVASRPSVLSTQVSEVPSSHLKGNPTGRDLLLHLLFLSYLLFGQVGQLFITTTCTASLPALHRRGPVCDRISVVNDRH